MYLKIISVVLFEYPKALGHISGGMAAVRFRKITVQFFIVFFFHGTVHLVPKLGKALSMCTKAYSYI